SYLNANSQCTLGSSAQRRHGFDFFRSGEITPRRTTPDEHGVSPAVPTGGLSLTAAPRRPMIGASKENTMRLKRIHVAGLAAVTSAALLSFVLLAADPEAERFWPQWRGPYANGVSRTADPPLEWSETKNIRWKIEIPGRGSSSPVVWGDRLFVSTAIPMGITGAAAHEPRGQIQPRDVHQFRILAIDRRTGRVLWERTPRQEQPRAPSMKDGTWASSSAITDGRRVFAFFDSSGLYAYDMQGTQLWEKSFG